MAVQTGPAGDALVIFGITGDLAKVMTCQALYRLEARGALTGPIVGVSIDQWSVDDLHKFATDAIDQAGEAIDTDVLERLLGRMAYVPGDFGDGATQTTP